MGIMFSTPHTITRVCIAVREVRPKAAEEYMGLLHFELISIPIMLSSDNG